MRSFVTRVLGVSSILVVTAVLSAAPVRDGDNPRPGHRDEPPVLKIIKKLQSGIRVLADTLTIPIP